MQPPSVVIAANPYEAELCRRALVETGLRVVTAEGGEGLLEMLAAERPLVLVMALGLLDFDSLELLREARAHWPALPIFLIGDREGEIRDEDSAVLSGATRLFLRPIDSDSLADAIEKRAVEAEIAEEVSEAMAEFSVRPPTIDAAPLVEESIVELEAEFEPDAPAPTRPVARIVLRRLPRETTEVVGAVVERRMARADDSEPPHPQAQPAQEPSAEPGEAPSREASSSSEQQPPPSSQPASEQPSSGWFSQSSSSPQPLSDTPAAPQFSQTAATELQPQAHVPYVSRVPSAQGWLDSVTSDSDGERDDDKVQTAPTEDELPPFEVTLTPTTPLPRAITEIVRLDPAGTPRAETLHAETPRAETLPTSMPSVTLPASGTRPRIFGERPPASGGAHDDTAGARQPLLRADDALADAAGLELGAMAGTPDFIGDKGGGGRVPFDERSTLARRLESELSAAERRLFPDSPASQSGRGAKRDDPYEDALGDIDLDQLGIDTIPGIGGDALDALRPRNGHGSTRDEPARPHEQSQRDPLAQRDPYAQRDSSPARDSSPVRDSYAQRDPSSARDSSSVRDSYAQRDPSPARDSFLEREPRDPPLSRLEPPIELTPEPAVERTPTLTRAVALTLPDNEGDLAESDLASLLAALHGGGFSGRFTASRADGEKSLYFDGGLPVFATSSFAHDRLAELLYRDGKISREQLTRARPLPDGGRVAAQKLVELGLIKSSELFATLRQHAEDILFSLFAWDSGRYVMTRELAAPEDRVRLGAPSWALIVEGVRRKYGLERLVELVGPPDVVLSPTANLLRAVEECALTPAERARAEAIDGERSLAEIALGGGPPLSEAALYAVAWSLCAIGAARIGSDEKGFAASALPTLVTPPISSDPSERDRRSRLRPDHRPRDREIDRAVDKERVLAKRAQIEEGDYFAVLGLSRDATAHEVARAFERLKREFAPDRFAESVRAELSDTLSEIAEVLDEAQRILGNAEIRAAYRSHLPPPGSS